MKDLPTYSVVVPTIGRPSLLALMEALQSGSGPRPQEIVVVDDRVSPGGELLTHTEGVASATAVRSLRSGGRGPAAARNLGWRSVTAEWAAFLDDDVVPAPHWAQQLMLDLCDLSPDVAGSQGTVSVPRPVGRKATDWERNVQALETACWATADLAYRRSILEEVGGFDDRFRRAFREDADLGLRVSQAGYTIVKGQRQVTHPVRPVDRWVSVRSEAGNADDELMTALHGRWWRQRAAAGGGRSGRHLMTAGSAGLAFAGLALRRRRLARAGALGWALGTAELTWTRIAPGPRTYDEVITMLCTSVALPFAATWHRTRGRLRHRSVLPASRTPQMGREPAPAAPRSTPPCAVLFDRDGTLVEDVPYNGDPSRVRTMPGAVRAIQRLRRHGVRVGIITNQSGVGRGLLTVDQVQAVNDRCEEFLGPIDTWQVCVHGPDDGCCCRKPAAGMIFQAAAVLGVPPSTCVVVGDIGADIQAAAAGGARGILVPTSQTLASEIAAAPEVVHDLDAAVTLALAGVR